MERDARAPGEEKDKGQRTKDNNAEVTTYVGARVSLELLTRFKAAVGRVNLERQEEGRPAYRQADALEEALRLWLGEKVTTEEGRGDLNHG